MNMADGALKRLDVFKSVTRLDSLALRVVVKARFGSDYLADFRNRKNIFLDSVSCIGPKTREILIVLCR